MINWQFNKEIDILEVHYEEIITLTEINEFVSKISMDKKLPRNLKILTDATKAKYNIQSHEIDELKQTLRKQLNSYEYIKAAFIHNNPKETALSILLQKSLQNINYYHKVFSTYSAAIKWLTK